MSIPCHHPAAPASVPPLPIYRFTVDQYHRMVPAGILGDEDPVELLDGVIVVKGNSTLAPAIAVLPRPGGNGRLRLPLRVRRFTVEEFHRLFDAGILDRDEPVELLEGWLVVEMSRNPPHDVALALALRLLGLCLPAGWHCRGQSAILTDVSEPEPDVAVVRGHERAYLENHPRPRDVGLVVEVSDTSLLSDRDLKGPLYARVNVPVYWIVNLPDMRVEVYTDPTGPDPAPCYRHREDYRAADQVPLVLDGVTVGHVPVADLLP